MTFSQKPSVQQQIAQTDIDALLIRLKTLREQIAQERIRVAPLETQMTLVYNDYQSAVRLLSIEANQLKAELYSLKEQLERVPGEQDVFVSPIAVDERIEPSREILTNKRYPPSKAIDPDEYDKEMLLIHLVRVLDDHMLNEEDSELFSRINGMFKDSKMHMGDVLEQVPWGIVWTQRNIDEDLKDHYQRLTLWERSLIQQLQRLTKKKDELYKDKRYAMYEQHQQGPLVWQQFLRHVVQQQQAYNDELRAIVQQKREAVAEVMRDL